MRGLRRLILGVVLLALIAGAAALGFAARGDATSKQLRPCPSMCHVNANGTRDIDLHWGDHLGGSTLKVGCTYSLGLHQQHPHLVCFGPGTKGYDPELVVDITRGAVMVSRCWNDCAKKEHLLTARR
jgi:hypothetical protein